MKENNIPINEVSFVMPKHKYWEVTFESDSTGENHNTHYKKTLYVNFKDFDKLALYMESELKKYGIDCFVDDPGKNITL